MKRKIFLSAVILMSAIFSRADEGKTNSPTAVNEVVYENNFEKEEVGKTPDEFLVLDGGFAVKTDGTNKFLELPGAPLETFGVLFGPTLQTNWAATAQFRGTAKGRRYPTFALGLNGAGLYKLQVSAAKKTIDLYRVDELVASTPFEQKVEGWFVLCLENKTVSENEWIISGKVWKQNAEEPKEASVSFTEKTKPTPGRATIWGSPYAGTPIQFDELKVISISR